MKEIKILNTNLSNIKYGWYDKDNNLHKTLNKQENFKDNYRMQNIEKIKENNYAICWEMCELERTYFKNYTYPFMIVIAIINDGIYMPNHTFLIFKNEEEKYCWFESSWKTKKGIWKYNKIEDLLYDIKKNFHEFTGSKNFNKESIKFYTYDKPPTNTTCENFLIHCITTGKIIDKNTKL